MYGNYSFKIQGMSVSNNICYSCGGLIYLGVSNLQVLNSVFSNNGASNNKL